MTNDTDFSQYDQFLKDAERDDRLGRQTMAVTQVTPGSWPSGEAYTQVDGVLTTAGNAMVNFRLSGLPSAEKMAAASGDSKMKRALAQTINMHKALAKLGKKAEALRPGDEFGVEIVKNKEGYIRVAMIMGPSVPSDVSRDNVPGF